jgi:hypothetical protein
METVAKRDREAHRPSRHCPVEFLIEAHMWHTKRGPDANLHCVLEELLLIEQISHHRFGWAPGPGKKRFPGSCGYS